MDAKSAWQVSNSAGPFMPLPTCPSALKRANSVVMSASFAQYAGNTRASYPFTVSWSKAQERGGGLAGEVRMKCSVKEVEGGSALPFDKLTALSNVEGLAAGQMTERACAEYQVPIAARKRWQLLEGPTS
jgi:hypothetical protein